MDTQLIPEDQWITFFDRFSRDHTGWTTTIRVLDPEIGPQQVADGLPLQGTSIDTKGSRPCSLQVSAGDDPARHVSHTVDMPLHIRQAREPDGSVDVQIEPADGPVTLVHLSAPAH